MLTINFNGSEPTLPQQEILKRLQLIARLARQNGTTDFPLSAIERINFSAMPARQQEVVEKCKTVSTLDSLDAEYAIRVHQWGGLKGYLDEETLRDFIGFEAAKDLTCKYYRKFLNLEAQKSDVSPDELAEHVFRKNEAVLYEEILDNFNRTHTNGRHLSQQECNRFALDYTAQRTPTSKDNFFKNLF